MSERHWVVKPGDFTLNIESQNNVWMVSCDGVSWVQSECRTNMIQFIGPHDSVIVFFEETLKNDLYPVEMLRINRPRE